MVGIIPGPREGRVEAHRLTEFPQGFGQTAGLREGALGVVTGLALATASLEGNENSQDTETSLQG